MKRLHKNRWYVVFLCIVILYTISIFAGPLIYSDRPEWSGTEALRKGDFKKALADVIADTAVTDSAFHFFKLGCIHQGLAHWSKALFYFRLHVQVSATYAPYAFEKIGDIELAQKRYGSALKAYRAAAEKTTLLPYRYTLYRKMYGLALQHSETLGKISWLEDIVGEDTGIPESSMKELFLQLIGTGKSKELDSALLKLIDPKLYNDAQCYICSHLASDTLSDSIFSTKTLYLLSELAYTCKQYDASSDWLHKALERKDFSKQIPRKSYMYHRAVLNYRMKNYGNVLKWGKRYHKNYGPNPTLVYMIARTYRSMGKRSQAAHWYDKHILLFPFSKKTHDIIWYRAWQKEDANKFTEARRLYKTLFDNHTKRKWGDNACFRYALSYCKEKKYGSALKAFSSFLKKFPSSPLVQGAHYWKAKCYFALLKHGKVRSECQAIIENAPSHYYAYRARELLVFTGDSLRTLAIDTSLADGEIASWLDSVAKDSQHSFTPGDSTQFYLGSLLAAVGMLNHAELLLESFEVSRGEDLFLQYTLARLYALCNDPTRSYRVARRLSWRIPSKAQSYMPHQVYALMYPQSFKEAIRKAAVDNDVEAELIRAIIRQESIFDPKIVSPVGAIGLMQIMPYTGEEIAKDLKEEFSPDSLYNPSVNVRFGSYYIKKLLKQFSGDQVLAIVGYNGGPHNAKKWRAQNSDDGFDMFIEDVGFTETRNYVKKVLGNFWTYKELNKKTPETDSGP